MALFASSLMHCQRRLQISRVKNIGNVSRLKRRAFRLASPYGGLRFLSFSFNISIVDCIAGVVRCVIVRKKSFLNVSFLMTINCITALISF